MAKNQSITDLNTVRMRVRALELFKAQGGLCFYCLARIRTSVDLTLDHVVPRAHGGTNHVGNLVVCCNSCNQHFADAPAKLKILWMLRHRPSN